MTTTYEYGLEDVQVGDEVLAVFKAKGSAYGVTDYEIGKVTKLNKKTFWVEFANQSVGDQRVTLTYSTAAPRLTNRFSKYFGATYLPATPHNRELVERQRIDRVERMAVDKKKYEAKETLKRIRYAEQQAVVLRTGWRPSDLALTTLPDGSRLYSGPIPVNPTYSKHKTFQQIIIRCKNVEDRDRDGEELKTITKVEAGYTYITDQAIGFSSVSISRYDNDDDAIMDTVTTAYYRW